MKEGIVNIVLYLTVKLFLLQKTQIFVTLFLDCIKTIDSEMEK